MPWIYEQASGKLLVNTVFVGSGYSGHGTGLNDPASQQQHNVGPLPTGRYTIGGPHSPPDHLGPLAMPLIPDPSNQMFGRFGFFVHGDNGLGNQSASDGCIIMGPAIRSQVDRSDDRTLVVVSGAALHHREGGHLALALGPVGMSEAAFAAGPRNAYPELPMLAFQRTSVTMTEVVATLNALAAPSAIKRASYVMFRNESGNGAKGINNNYVGAQADGGRWPESLTDSFTGTVTLRENGTMRSRIFLAFKALEGNLDFLMNRVASRGLFIGGRTHLVLTMNVDDEGELVRAYHKEWVSGSAVSEPSAAETAAFLSMYRQATRLIA